MNVAFERGSISHCLFPTRLYGEPLCCNPCAVDTTGAPARLARQHRTPCAESDRSAESLSAIDGYPSRWAGRPRGITTVPKRLTRGLERVWDGLAESLAGRSGARFSGVASHC